MYLPENSETIKVPCIEKKAVRNAINQFIQKHNGQQPQSIFVSLQIMSAKLLKGFNIPVKYGSGLQPNEIVVVL